MQQVEKRKRKRRRRLRSLMKEKMRIIQIMMGKIQICTLGCKKKRRLN